MRATHEQFIEPLSRQLRRWTDELEAGSGSEGAALQLSQLAILGDSVSRIVDITNRDIAQQA